MPSELEKLDAMWGGVEPAPTGETMFEPIPEGKVVRAAIVHQEPRRVGEKNTPVVKIQLQVKEGPYAKKVVFGDLWITENNAGNLKRDLGFLGWKGQKVSQLMVDTDASLVGLGAELVVKINTYNKILDNGSAETRRNNEVKYFSAPWTPPAASAGRPEERDEDSPI